MIVPMYVRFEVPAALAPVLFITAIMFLSLAEVGTEHLESGERLESVLLQRWSRERGQKRLGGDGRYLWLNAGGNGPCA